MLEICEIIGLDNLKFSPLTSAGFRKPGITWEYTEKEKQIINDLLSQPAFFFEKMIKDKDASGNDIFLYEYQKSFLEKVKEKRFVQLLWPRQMGASMLARTLALFWAFQGKKVAFVMRNGSSVVDALEKLQRTYIISPLAFKPGVISWNKFGVKFENGGEIEGVSRNFQSKSFDIVIADNPFEWQISGIMPVLSSFTESQFILISKKPHENFFQNIEYWKSVPGRDDSWKQKEIIALGSAANFLKEYGDDYISKEDLIFKTDEIRSRINLAIDELIELHKKGN